MWFCRDLWSDAATGGLKDGKRAGHVKLNGHRRGLGDAPKKRELGVVEEAYNPDPKVKITETEDGPKAVANKEDPGLQRRQMGGNNQEHTTADDEQGTDVDAIDEETQEPPEPLELPASAYLVPNSAYTPARILVNPRCVTTYGGVSHTQLALDLFGNRDEPQHTGGNYVLDDWAGPPDSFVCQEMRTTGGRTAPKSQRRVGFLLQNEVSHTPVGAND